MKLSDGLRESLEEHFAWNKSRLDCLVGLLLSLLRIKQVNLTQLALAFSSSASEGSRYRRLQRFFREVCFDYDVVASLILHQFGFDQQSYYLTLDRTNWKWGKTNRNILTLAVIHKGMAIPAYCLLLNRPGNSNQRERIALMKRFIKQFGHERILAGY